MTENAHTQIKTKGYFYDIRRNMYRVQLVIEGKRKTLGSYPTHYEAEAVYERAKLQEIERKKKAKEAKNANN